MNIPEDVPIVFVDTDPANPLYIKPARFWGKVLLHDDTNEPGQRVFMLSDTNTPFPRNCYLKHPLNEECDDDEDYYAE